MYEEHFGLRPRPFGATRGGTSLIRLPSRDAAHRRLRYALEHVGGPALLVGPSGIGKTLLALALGVDLAGPVVHLTFAALPAADLVALLTDEIDPASAAIESSTFSGWSPNLRRLRSSLAAAASRDARPLVIVDDAHLIGDPATWDALRLLLNFNSEGPPDLRLLIVGTSEVLGLIPVALDDRITARSTMGALTLSESSRYVLGRLELAGATGPLIDPAALAELHQAAEGNIRRLDRLADLALLVAAADDRPTVNARQPALAMLEPWGPTPPPTQPSGLPRLRPGMLGMPGIPLGKPPRPPGGGVAGFDPLARTRTGRSAAMTR